MRPNYAVQTFKCHKDYDKCACSWRHVPDGYRHLAVEVLTGSKLYIVYEVQIPEKCWKKPKMVMSHAQLWLKTLPINVDDNKWMDYSCLHKSREWDGPGNLSTYLVKTLTIWWPFVAKQSLGVTTEHCFLQRVGSTHKSMRSGSCLVLYSDLMSTLPDVLYQ